MKFLQNRLHRSALLIAFAVAILANSSNPPNGRTQAPFDGTCAAGGCHSSQNPNIMGSVAVAGLPSTIEPNTTYNLTLTATSTTVLAELAGYQLVAVQGNNTTAGDLVATDALSGTEMFGGREYIDHRGAQPMNALMASWDFNWVSPPSSNGNIVKFYFTANLADGNNNTSGDRIVASSLTIPFAGAPALTAAITATTNVACNGGNTGSATVTGSGGTPPYTYLWSNGQTDETAINLAAGTYMVTVKDANLVTASATAPITQPPAITTSISAPGTITCLNTAITATATAAGGVGGFSYSWSSGDVGNPISVTMPGPLTVSVTDSNGCTKMATVNVAGNIAAPTAVANAAGDISCDSPTTTVSGAGSSTGGNFTYLWTGPGIVSGSTTLTATVNQPGDYTLKVTNTTNGCTSTDVATVSSTTSPPTAMASNGGAISCTNPTTTVTVATNAGNADFAWTGPGGFTSTQQSPSVTMAGTYNVIVTNNNNGCTATASTSVVGNTTQPSASATGGNLTCAVPTVQLTATTNAANPIFAWTGPNGFTSALQNPSVGAPGTYTVVITQPSNGCTNSATASVTGDATIPSASATSAVLTCSATSVVISASSNITGATFAWTGPNGFTSNLQNPTVSVAGPYNVVVTNPANGCTNSASSTVVQNIAQPGISAAGGTITCTAPTVVLNGNSPANPVTYLWTGPGGFNSALQNPTVGSGGTYNLVVTNTDNGCTNIATAEVLLNNAAPGATATGGAITCVVSVITLNGNSPINPVNYSWTGPGGYTSTLQNPLSTDIGTYNLLVTNPANGCTSEATAIITQNTTAPTAAATAPGQLSCNATSIQLNATTSSQGSEFSYLWTTTDGNIVSGATTLTPIVNAIGTYNLLITNTLNGCTATTSVVVSAIPAVTSSISNQTNVGCNGGSNGSATVTAGGGTGNFTYLWSNGQTTATATNLTAGSYSVSVNDATGGCVATASATISQPDVLTANATATAVTTNGGTDGTATANPAGGTAGFTYLWSNNAMTQTISGLAPGSYAVIVTDANGCTASQTVTVNAFGCAITATGSAANVTCFGAANGTATANTTGANLPITYLWSTGGTTETISGLAPGDYACSITDASGCPATISVSISQPNALAANASATAVTANGATDGTATAQPTGGSPNYTFLWDNQQTTQTITGLAPGNYSVSVTDANGCTAIQTVMVNPFNCVLASSVNAVNITCFGLNNGQATAILTGGTAPFTYLWSNGQTTATATNLVPGDGSVNITDAAGCATSATFSVSQPAAFVPAAATIVDNICAEGTTGQVTINLTGGTPNYTYLWSNGQTTNPAINLPVGNITCSVTDANGCTHVETNAVIAKDQVAPQITCPANVSGCEGIAVAEEGLGGPVFTDNCSLGTNQPVRTGAWAANHIYPVGTTQLGYTITDVQGNTASCTFNVVVHENPVIVVNSTQNDIGNAGLGSIDVTLTGGPFMSIVWNKNGAFFSSSEDLTGLNAGNYSLIVTNNFGCETQTATITITNTVGTESPAAKSLRILPNPVLDILRIETDAVVAEIRLSDSRGRQLLFEKEDLRELDLSAIAPGVYFLQIRLADGSLVTRRVVKL